MVFFLATMGCSAAKNLTVEPMGGGGVDLNGISESRKVSIPRKNSDVPPLIGEEPQTEMLENTSVNNFTKTSKFLFVKCNFKTAPKSKKKHKLIAKHKQNVLYITNLLTINIRIKFNQYSII